MKLLRDRKCIQPVHKSNESVLLTTVIDAKEGRNVATCDITNAFIQTGLQTVDCDRNRTIMKIRVSLVGILCEMDQTHSKYVINEEHRDVMHVHVRKAIYSLLVSAMLLTRK
jgi:hypothetical protein